MSTCPWEDSEKKVRLDCASTFSCRWGNNFHFFSYLGVRSSSCQNEHVCELMYFYIITCTLISHCMFLCFNVVCVIERNWVLIILSDKIFLLIPSSFSAIYFELQTWLIINKLKMQEVDITQKVVNTRYLLSACLSLLSPTVSCVCSHCPLCILG